MGSAASNIKRKDLPKAPSNGKDENKPSYTTLGLTADDITAFYVAFNKLDRHNAAAVGLSELLAFVNAHQHRVLIKKIFSAPKRNSEHIINFFDFVCAVWNFCTLDRVSLASFAFALYDVNNNKAIDKNELFHMLYDVFGVDYETDVHAAILRKKLDEIGTITVTLDYFVNLAKIHEHLLYPVLVLQDKFQSVIGDDMMWFRLTSFRQKNLPISQYIPIGSMIEENFNPEEHKNKPAPALRVETEKSVDETQRMNTLNRNSTEIGDVVSPNGTSRDTPNGLKSPTKMSQGGSLSTKASKSQRRHTIDSEMSLRSQKRSTIKNSPSSKYTVKDTDVSVPRVSCKMSVKMSQPSMKAELTSALSCKVNHVLDFGDPEEDCRSDEGGTKSTYFSNYSHPTASNPPTIHHNTTEEDDEETRQLKLKYVQLCDRGSATSAKHRKSI